MDCREKKWTIVTHCLKNSVLNPLAHSGHCPPRFQLRPAGDQGLHRDVRMCFFRLCMQDGSFLPWFFPHFFRGGIFGCKKTEAHSHYLEKRQVGVITAKVHVGRRFMWVNGCSLHLPPRLPGSSQCLSPSRGICAQGLCSCSTLPCTGPSWHHGLSSTCQQHRHFPLLRSNLRGNLMGSGHLFLPASVCTGSWTGCA